MYSKPFLWGIIYNRYDIKKPAVFVNAGIRSWRRPYPFHGRTRILRHNHRRRSRNHSRFPRNHSRFPRNRNRFPRNRNRNHFPRNRSRIRRPWRCSWLQFLFPWVRVRLLLLR
jgi:hypothetical protein